MGSIPIARSINPVDAVGFTGFPPLISPLNYQVFDVVGREIHPEKSFGRDETQPVSEPGGLEPPVVLSLVLPRSKS
jgi:hypothetical protein